MSQTTGVVTHLNKTIGTLEGQECECEYAAVFTKELPTQELYIYRVKPFLSVLQAGNRIEFDFPSNVYGNKLYTCKELNMKLIEQADCEPLDKVGPREVAFITTAVFSTDVKDSEALDLATVKAIGWTSEFGMIVVHDTRIAAKINPNDKTTIFNVKVARNPKCKARPKPRKIGTLWECIEVMGVKKLKSRGKDVIEGCPWNFTVTSEPLPPSRHTSLLATGDSTPMPPTTIASSSGSVLPTEVGDFVDDEDQMIEDVLRHFEAAEAKRGLSYEQIHESNEVAAKDELIVQRGLVINRAPCSVTIHDLFTQHFITLSHNFTPEVGTICQFQAPRRMDGVYDQGQTTLITTHKAHHVATNLIEIKTFAHLAELQHVEAIESWTLVATSWYGDILVNKNQTTCDINSCVYVHAMYLYQPILGFHWMALHVDEVRANAFDDMKTASELTSATPSVSSGTTIAPIKKPIKRPTPPIVSQEPPRVASPPRGSQSPTYVKPTNNAGDDAWAEDDDEIAYGAAAITRLNNNNMADANFIFELSDEEKQMDEEIELSSVESDNSLMGDVHRTEKHVPFSSDNDSDQEDDVEAVLSREAAKHAASQASQQQLQQQSPASSLKPSASSAPIEARTPSPHRPTTPTIPPPRASKPPAVPKTPAASQAAAARKAPPPRLRGGLDSDEFSEGDDDLKFQEHDS